MQKLETVLWIKNGTQNVNQQMLDWCVVLTLVDY